MAKLMAHLVAGYPTDDIAFLVATSLIEGGADILEVQLAFSDPSADGVAIQEACCTVLKNSYDTKKGMAFIKKIHDSFPLTPIYIMTYASLAFVPTVKHFAFMAKQAGASGLIIPDLPFDNDEGLRNTCNEYGLLDIPVAAPSMAKSRLELMIKQGFPYIYAALRIGITGTNTLIDSNTKSFLKAVSAGGAKLYGGFGISTGEQVRQIASLVEAAVAGSVFVRLISKYKDNTEQLSQYIKEKAQELKG